MDDVDFKRRLNKLEQDMYYGNGKPGMTTRMALMEEVVGTISKNLSKIVWLLVSILAMFIAKMFVK